MNELLFNKSNLSLVIGNQEAQVSNEIDAFDSNQLLNTPVDDLVKYFFEKYKINPINILTEKISVAQSETKIDVSRDSSRAIFDRSRPFYISGTRITFYVPFEGDKELFNCRPSHFNFDPPRAEIIKNEIQITYEVVSHDSDQLKARFEGDLHNIRQYLGWIEQDIKPFNEKLPSIIHEQIERRRKKLLDDQGMVASLGFPLRQRADAPKTYTAPVERKKIKSFPATAIEPFVPEPALAIDEYEHILSIISNMVLVMERSPNAFRDMKEEDIRQHFLVQLNSQYEGQATGETFNYEGKTDILIRANNKNIFIAECKFWRGEKTLLETIDQLLRYASWRDTKTAILIFNRNKNFSEVVHAIPESVKQHTNFKRQVSCKGETNSRYIFGQVNDPNREITITIMAFDVPGND